MGSATCSIIGWTTQIVAKVPNVPAGSYDLSLVKGEHIVSTKLPFKVQTVFPVMK
jgi:hypothetical protein